MVRRDFITVEELNSYINNIFLHEELLHNVPVVGEVSGCSVVGGHCYFNLKDAKAQIKVCLFNCAGKYVPHNGAKVLVRGSVDYYVKNGQISVRAYEVVYFGAGLLHIRFEELKEKLEREGLFREEHKKSIPASARRVGIITSIKGAAVQDFITTFRRHNTVADITVIDVRVQGEGCASDVLTAVNNADDYGFDVIVVTRGGGSYEDLFGFNDERLARAVYNMRTPVVSAIGHETDYTLCDFVADWRAITPTAAAEKIAFSTEQFKSDVLLKLSQIAELCEKTIDKEAGKFLKICGNMQNKVRAIINDELNYLLNTVEKIKIYANVNFKREKSVLTQILSDLERYNPLKLLKNGYFRILKDNEYIYDFQQLKINDRILILGAEGEIEAEVKSKGAENELRKKH